MTADTLAIAQWLVMERGLSVIPIDHPADTTQTDPKRIGKVPAITWANFQETRPSLDNLHAWFGDGNGHRRNIAIVTGKISGVVVIDADNDEAEMYAREHLPATPMMTRTSRGTHHRFYRHPGGTIRNKVKLRTAGAALALDLRADGGYVVAPGSVHASGARYERVGDWPPITELPVFDPSWIAADDAGEHQCSPRQNQEATTSCFLPDREHLLRRARAYVASVPPAIEGQGGDAHTFQLACKLVRGFALSDADTFDVLREWNHTCVPPWTDAALEAKIDGARKYGDEPIGARLDDPQHARTPQAVRSRPVPTAGINKQGGTPEPATAPSTFNLTDSGNAEYFAARHDQDLRFDFQRRRWLLWRTHRWQPDADAEIRRLAKAAMRQRFKDAATLDDPDARSRAAKWAIGSESRARLDALLYLSQAEPPIADSGVQWDMDPWLLGVPNGVIDLRTGTLRPARRADRITLCAGVEFHADAQSDLWHHALRTILPDDGLRDFFQVAIGYSSTGDTRRDCWFLACGEGRNGKGTLFQSIRHALGDYALELPGSIFDLRAKRSPYELAYLPGRRFVTSSEAGDTLRLHHDRIKQLSGGDSVSAANKYEKAFEFEPTCKLWLACNKRPRTTDDSPAFWSRVFLLPFTTSFAGKEDRSLRPALVQEPVHQRAVLAWIVRGAIRYHAEGLNDPPASVRVATDAYREDSDPLAAFLGEACEVEPAAEVGAKELYEHYGHWADAQHFTVKERLSATSFGRLIGGRFEREHTHAGKLYRGLARRPL